MTNLLAFREECCHCLASRHQHLACWNGFVEWVCVYLSSPGSWRDPVADLTQVSSLPCKSYISHHLQLPWMFTFSCLGLVALCSCWHRSWIPYLQVEVGLSLGAHPGYRNDLGRGSAMMCWGSVPTLCPKYDMVLSPSLHKR